MSALKKVSLEPYAMVVLEGSDGVRFRITLRVTYSSSAFVSSAKSTSFLISGLPPPLPFFLPGAILMDSCGLQATCLKTPVLMSNYRRAPIVPSEAVHGRR